MKIEIGENRESFYIEITELSATDLIKLCKHLNLDLISMIDNYSKSGNNSLSIQMLKELAIKEKGE